jgi:hypothetical protein
MSGDPLGPGPSEALPARQIGSFQHSEMLERFFDGGSLFRPAGGILPPDRLVDQLNGGDSFTRNPGLKEKLKRIPLTQSTNLGV